MTIQVAHISALLFDWDGTLSDTAAAGLEAFKNTFRDLGYPFSQNTYETTYSPNWYSMYEAIGLPQEHWARADRLWLSHYGHQPPAFVDGAGEVVEELRRRGYRFGIVSSGTCSRIHREVEQLGLQDRVEAIVCNEATVNKKPHPEGLHTAMARMRCSPDHCCYIGDSPEDIQMGRRAGMLTVGVPSGYPTSRNLAAEGPDLCLNSIRDLLRYFKGPGAWESA